MQPLRIGPITIRALSRVFIHTSSKSVTGRLGVAVSAKDVVIVQLDNLKRARAKREVSPRRKIQHEESGGSHVLRYTLNSPGGVMFRSRRGIHCHWGQLAGTEFFQRAVSRHLDPATARSSL